MFSGQATIIEAQNYYGAYPVRVIPLIVPATCAHQFHRLNLVLDAPNTSTGVLRLHASTPHGSADAIVLATATAVKQHGDE